MDLREIKKQLGRTNKTETDSDTDNKLMLPDGRGVEGIGEKVKGLQNTNW